MQGKVRAPLIGRQHELAELWHILDQALQKEAPQSVILIGNQGVGKTRLVNHWLKEVREKNNTVRVYCTKSTPQSPSYGLFTSFLKSRFNLREGDEVAEAIRSQLGEILEDRRVTEVLHFLGTFIGIEVRDNPFLRAVEHAPAQHDQIARTVLRRFLEMDAQRSPLLLVFEDIHHADEASLSLLHELGESLEGARIMMMCTCRPELLVRQPEFFSVKRKHYRLDLPLLDRDESKDLLCQLLSRVDEIPADLMETAADMTGGNPFFIEELVHVLLANGTIQDQGEKWTIDVERVGEAELPLSVEEAVYARIAALNPMERDVLEKASTLGSVFWLEALVCFSRLQQEVAEKYEIWMADVLQQTIRELLDGLIERDYLLQLPDSSIPHASEYAFKHNLERDLIAKMVNPEQMRQYHLFAAQWFETKLPDRSESQLEYLGQHYEQGGNRRRAAFCFVNAGDKARARYANEQAATFYRRGIALLDLDDALSKIEALHNLGDVCTLLGWTTEALDHFSEMLRYAWLLDHKGKGGAAHRRIGRLWASLGDYERVLGHFNMALRLFERASDSRGVAATLDDVGQIALLKGLILLIK